MRKAEYIVIHHSATKDGVAEDWKGIVRFHTSFRWGGKIVSPEEAVSLRASGENVTAPWPYVGYNFGIERVNGGLTYHKGARVGDLGFHCREAYMNHRSIGVCVVGDYDKEQVPEDTMMYLRNLCWALMVNHKIPPEKVIGHREAGMMDGYDWLKGQYKTCPGTRFSLDGLRSLVGGG